MQRPEDDVVRDALIQRFEFTFEMAWKTLFRFLDSKGEKVAFKAWDVLPVAFQARLIKDAQTWERMRELRNDTSHEYHEAKVIEAAAFVRKSAYAVLLALRDELAGRKP